MNERIHAIYQKAQARLAELVRFHVFYVRALTFKSGSAELLANCAGFGSDRPKLDSAMHHFVNPGPQCASYQAGLPRAHI